MSGLHITSPTSTVPPQQHTSEQRSAAGAGQQSGRYIQPLLDVQTQYNPEGRGSRGGEQHGSGAMVEQLTVLLLVLWF